MNYQKWGKFASLYSHLGVCCSGVPPSSWDVCGEGICVLEGEGWACGVRLRGESVPLLTIAAFVGCSQGLSRGGQRMRLDAA